MFIGCTKATLKHITKADTFQCVPCARGTYTFDNESLNTSFSFKSKIITKHEHTNFTCLDCPVGANYTAFIRSKSNFYGYITKEQKLKFLPCLRGFVALTINVTPSTAATKTGLEFYVEGVLRTIWKVTYRLTVFQNIPVRVLQSFG